MWPFSKKVADLPPYSPYVLADEDGVVEQIMFDHVVVSGRRYDCRVPMARCGQQVVAGQPVGKK